MNSSGISYVPRPDATPEGELDALANVYAYILRCVEEKKKAEPASPAESTTPAQGG